MRQLGDLLVWAALMTMLAAVVYLTPRVAEYVSGDGQPAWPVNSAQGFTSRVPGSGGVPRRFPRTVHHRDLGGFDRMTPHRTSAIQ